MNFTFADAEGLLDYISDLGVSDLYLSPILEAAKGSLHGYDGVDHNKISSELGGRKGFDSLASSARRRHLGILLDIVPNHVSASDENQNWMSVLEYGSSSPYSSFFDIDWTKKGNPKKKIFLPILDDFWENFVAAGRVRVIFDEENARFYFQIYGSRKLPLNAKSCGAVLELCASELKGNKRKSKLLKKVASYVEAFGKLPANNHSASTSLYKDAEILKKRFQSFLASNPEVGRLIQSVLSNLDKSSESRKRFIMLLADEQFYVLGHSVKESAKLNYRRFFEVSDLVGIRVEDPKVFFQTHGLIFELLERKMASGLRVDHPDGLLDPTAYFARLQRRFGGTLFVIAEKILMEHEKLNEAWKVCGTTGYDFARDSTQLFVHPSEKEFTSIYQRFSGNKRTFGVAAYLGKKTVVDTQMQSELSRVTDIADKIMVHQSLGTGDISAVLEELVCRFLVYRTYVTEKTRKLPADQKAYVKEALESARSVDRKALSYARKLLLLERVNGADPRKAKEFVLRFQQFTGPVMAKGVEDTAFYTYNRLASLNEVGGNPGNFGIDVEEFHSRNILRAKMWPHTMLSSSTHDTKRSEDVRARINVLSEIPDEWRKSLSIWSKVNAKKKSGKLAPSRNNEYLLYQTLLGAWPLDKKAYGEFVERIVAYEKKASKEAKENTSWLEPNRQYDSALESFVRKILERSPKNKFLEEFVVFQEKISYFGMLNSLSALLLKLTCPGFPDIYQGNETWDYSLVDPDNRRPVDFVKRRRILARLSKMMGKGPRGELPARLLQNWKDGMVKMFVLSETLRYRNDRVELFSEGDYLPVYAEGEKSNHLCSFARRYRGERCLVVAPRFFAKLAGTQMRLPLGVEIWGKTKLVLPDNLLGGEVENIFTGETLRTEDRHLLASKVFSKFPVVLLTPLQEQNVR